MWTDFLFSSPMIERVGGGGVHCESSGGRESPSKPSSYWDAVEGVLVSLPSLASAHPSSFVSGAC